MMDVTKNVRKLIKGVYSINYPKNEMYGLQSQIRRAAVSVSLNIIEGNARNSPKDYLKFCYIARGSLAEVKECLQISLELKYIGADVFDMNDNCSIIGRQLTKLIQYLKSKI